MINNYVLTELINTQEEVVESNYSAQNGYVTFAQAAEIVGVRYQQVFQRAVVKGHMTWKQTPTNQVLLADVLEWKAKRAK
jgi:hypothetical protein